MKFKLLSQSWKVKSGDSQNASDQGSHHGAAIGQHCHQGVHSHASTSSHHSKSSAAAAAAAALGDGEEAQCLFLGIDLGASGSAYTYAFDTDPRHIKLPPQWPGDRHLEAKTSTALLYEVLPCGKWQCIDWGTTAVKRYTTSRNPDERRKWRLLEGKQFKMALADNLAGFPATYKLPTDCPLNPQDIIAEMLSRMQQHAADHLRTSTGLELDELDVHYCLSVPAGWSPLAKDIMKQAAQAAGLTKYQSGALPDDSSDSSWLDASAVTLVHEQEAAAVTACWDPYSSWGGLKAIPGSVWVVVDAGGGTVDIALHRVEAGAAPGEAHLSEVMESACLPWGSSMVDRQAEEALLRPLFPSDAAYEHWKSMDPASFLRQMLKWEDAKKEFVGNNDVWLEFVNTLTECLPAASPERGQGGMYLEAHTMKKIFDPILHHILEQVKFMVSQRRTADGKSGADVLLLCGGFGSSEYLRRQLEKACGKHVGRIVSPVDAQKAVVLGNTTHLMRPQSIIARCSRLTYGVRCCHLPKEGCEKSGQIAAGPKGSQVCMAHFKRLVQAGQIVSIDQKTEPWRLVPLPGSESIILEIYATEQADAQHVTERHMRKVGDVTLAVKKQVKKVAGVTVGKQASADYNIDLCFLFGAAEIHVEAYDITNNRLIQSKVRFSSEPEALPVVLPSGN